MSVTSISEHTGRSSPRAGVTRIEVWGRPAGFAIPARRGVRFVAGSPYFSALDGAAFPTLGHARLAAIAEARTAPPYQDGWDH